MRTAAAFSTAFAQFPLDTASRRQCPGGAPAPQRVTAWPTDRWRAAYIARGQPKIAMMSDGGSGRWAKANRKTGSRPEVRLRAMLHRRGHRFRKNVSIRLPGITVRPDVVFTRVRVAVFVDGCFWHACPEHGGLPRSNNAYWMAKLEGNVRRDRLVDERLRAAGWTVVRLWEHVPVNVGAETVAATVTAARSCNAIPSTSADKAGDAATLP